jgi:hypothetical protein
VCSNCHTSIANIFRSCTNGCGLDLCLSCERTARTPGPEVSTPPRGGGAPSASPCMGTGPDGKPCKGELGLYRMPRMEQDLLSLTMAHASQPSSLGGWGGAWRPAPFQ